MPRDGGTPLARFAHALARDDGLTVGAPRLSDDGSVAVLPLLRTVPRPRGCVLAAEASDAVSAVDPGRLDRLTVRNDAPFAVFLPPGTLFRSDVTASRGTTAGIVLGPRSDASIEVKCVHASCALVVGAPLLLDRRLAPDAVCRALLSRDQGRVWAAVAQLVGDPPAPPPAESDDLLAALSDDPAPGSVSDVNGPTRTVQPGQCGVVILDGHGVFAVECYDSPEAWKVAAEAARGRSPLGSRPAVRPPWTASLDPAGALRTAREFIAQLAERPLHRAAPSSWVAEDSSLVCTVWDGALVHLIAFGSQDAMDGRDTQPGLAAWGIGAQGSSSLAPGLPVVTDAGEGGVAAVEVAAAEVPEDEAPAAARPRRRKVLTSGWDDVTFGALDRYADKEFRGDRSAAMRFLVRHGLRARGYFGPSPLRPHMEAASTVPQADAVAPPTELARAGLESRIEDLERIAETPQYAIWLRKRARLELERMASALEDDLVRAAAQAAVDRLSPVEPEPEPREPVEPEVPVPPPSPPPEVRSLLRQAFAASAGGDYKQAVALFDRILEAEADNRTARLGRAVALRRAGKSQEALDDLEVVLDREPRNAAALLARGQILQARGDLDAALASFDLLVEVAATDWDVWMVRGDVLAKMSRNEDALRSYDEALRRNPDDQELRARIRTLEIARAPAPPTTLPRPAAPPGIEEGQSYLVQESRHERSQSLFRALAGLKIPSLVLTGRSRDLVRRELGVSGARIIGLSFSPGEDLHNPTALASLVRTVERFVFDNQGHGVILLDGLHDLVANNGFRDTALCIERIHETILQSRAILIVSFAPEDLGEREAALLERSLRLLS